MERYRVIGSVDNFDGQQDLNEWIQMIERAAEFAGWNPEQAFKAALFRLRGEAGEFAEQLREEEKLSNWEELKTALKERYNTAGKEQWHQYLLNTATQGSKTVQEWAQTVRKLSILALGSEGIAIKTEDQRPEEAPADHQEETGAGAAPNEARKKLLDFMRKSNFVRGLRSSLRQMVWRKKCVTFDDAVRAAAEEQAVECSHREEEVLSCYKRDIPNPANNSALIEQIVAALELRDEEKRKKDKERTRKGESGGKSTSRRTQADEPDSDTEQDRSRTEEEQRQHVPGTGNFTSSSNARQGGQRRDNRQYERQLPLPRVNHTNQWSGRRQEWTRQGWRNEPPTTWRDYGRGQGPITCYGCGEIGHMRRNCPRALPPPSGNGYRRL